MKEQKWDDFDGGKEFLDSPVLNPEENEETRASQTTGKHRVTELRRRIEERLESKRIALEYDYLELEEIDLSDDLSESSDPLL